MKSRSTCCLLAIAVSGLLQGCGDSGPPRLPVYKVTGKITFNGNPVADADVTFSPRDKQAVASGRTDKDGKFTLTTYVAGDGAAEGGYSVLVTKSRPTNAAKPPAHGLTITSVDGAAMHSATQAQAESGADAAGIPSRYSLLGQSDLSADVKKSSSPQEVTLELKP